ncbi:Single-strand DNA binding protein (modular protein) [Nocardia brasiliensis ATCC 700358]|uniref:Single-strand DNA binding protein (Modular protein) n=1 Tax=Nocardia brasiliensis (strain ATCC 700358 / HUJEG-1) TaxID=1133849 RepID=K0ENS4_NOCB7|nr:Single-strand DNA binding protein (modular protein) [Nocardia brasiliensis ATCC 700358]
MGQTAWCPARCGLGIAALRSREYRGRDGVERRNLEMRATAVGPDLARCTAQVTRWSLCARVHPLRRTGLRLPRASSRVPRDELAGRHTGRVMKTHAGALHWHQQPPPDTHPTLPRARFRTPRTFSRPARRLAERHTGRLTKTRAGAIH